MPRNKEDRAKISRQEWEIQYIRGLARGTLKALKATGIEGEMTVHTSTLKRLAKAVLKFTKK